MNLCTQHAKPRRRAPYRVLVLTVLGAGSFLCAGAKTIMVPTTEKSSIKTEVRGKEVTSSVVVNAPCNAVFDAIRKQRTDGPGRRKLVSFEGQRAIVQENFWHLPIIGTATCNYEELEQPCSRIDYKMLSSDKLKRFEGCWLLSSRDSGFKTLLTLRLLCDAGINIPFADQIIAGRARSAVLRRLVAVKVEAEKQRGCTTIGREAAP